jgi:hypothetical protein
MRKIVKRRRMKLGKKNMKRSKTFIFHISHVPTDYVGSHHPCFFVFLVMFCM